MCSGICLHLALLLLSGVCNTLLLLGMSAAAAIAASFKCAGVNLGPDHATKCTSCCLVQVHAPDHAGFNDISAMLTNVLANSAQQQARFSNTPITPLVQSTCVAGCVQLLGSVIGWRGEGAGPSAAADGSSGVQGGSSGATADDTLLASGGRNTGSLAVGFGDLLDSLQLGVNQGLTQWAGKQQVPVPAVDYAVNSKLGQQWEESSQLYVVLQGCHQAALATGFAGHLGLSVRVGGLMGHDDAKEYRLVAYNAAGVITDMTGSIRNGDNLIR